MKIIILVLLLSFIGSNAPHYDDQDGHREPWTEWVESSCVDEPRIIMDSSPYCNPNTDLGVTVWQCDNNSDETYHWSYYTAHWHCGVIGEALQKHKSYLPLVTR